MCVCVSFTFSLTRIAEHCRGTPIILCGFHVTEFALQSLIYVLMYWGCFTKDFFKLTIHSTPMFLPLHSTELMAMLPGHQKSATPRSLRRHPFYWRVCRQGQSITTAIIKIQQWLFQCLLLTSTWSHKLYFSQISAISLIGSNAPYTVEPAVAFTNNGT